MKYTYLSLLLTASLSFSADAQSLSEAKALIKSKKYDEAAEMLEKLINDGEANLPKDEALYLAARAHFLDKDYKEAREIANKLVVDFKDSIWLNKAKFLIADSLHLENNHEEAVKLYKGLLADILKLDRKVEVANKLIGYADELAEEKQESGVVIKKADYATAYNLYKEVLDIECGNELREKVRLKMIEAKISQKQYGNIEKECLDYLGEFDEAWRGKIGSVARITSKKIITFKAKGSSVAIVRYRLAESLHRQQKRDVATMYLNELIKSLKDNSISAPKGLLADSEWLRLFTLNKPGGKPKDLTYWVKEAKTFLVNYPTHIHSHMTARLIASHTSKWGDKEEGKKLYKEFINSALGAKIVRNPNTSEEEDEKKFTARQQAAVKRIEAAHFILGELYLSSNEFDEAQNIWTRCLEKFPNGEKWPIIQKKISQLDYKRLLFELSKLSTEENLVATSEQATKLIDSFIEKFPLHEELELLLYQQGGIPYSLAQKMLDAGENEEANRLFKLALNGWKTLQQRFPKSSNALKALELSGKIYLEHFNDLEKGVELLERANTPTTKVLVNSLKREVLIASTPGIFTLDEKAYVDLETQNLEKVKVKIYWMDIKSYWEKSGDLSKTVDLDFDLIEPDKTWEYTIKDFKKLKRTSNRLEIPFANGKPGFCVVKVESEEFESTTLVQRSNIDLAVRSSTKDIIAFVKNAKTNKPQANAKVTIASAEKIILEGETDANGIFYSELKLPANQNSYRVLVNDKQGAATSSVRGLFEVDNNDSFQTRGESGSFGNGLFEVDKLKAWFLVDRNEVRKGDLVKLNAVVRQLEDGEYIYPENKEFKLIVKAGGVKLTVSDQIVSYQLFVNF